jgi:nitrous oxide reductase accessory protein NosL
MKRFRLLSVIFFIMIVLGACEQKPKGGVEKMHWDRDMCERCKMAVSERKYAVQIVNPKTDRAYKFDDIGCAILWLDEEKIPWAKEAIVWITDAKTGKWIDAKTALYTDDSITPMAFGFAAFTKETKPKNHRIIGYETVQKEVFEIEKLNQKKGQY